MSTSTSDAANRALTAGVLGYPEMDDQEDIDITEDQGIYDYVRINVVESINTGDFRNTFMNLKNDIDLFPFLQRRFLCENMLDKIYEEYDFQFSETIPITTEIAIDSAFELIQFIEYDNVSFLSFVWEILKVDILKVDIEATCKRNGNKIIKEVEEQSQIYGDNGMIALFLRTYYKEKFIEWFVRESENSKTDIKLKILEREGKLNG